MMFGHPMPTRAPSLAARSGARREELLFTKPELEAVWKLRRVLQGLAEDGSAAKGLELLQDRMKATRTNAEFLAEIARAPSVSG